jgi:hypothetical protein
MKFKEFKGSRVCAIDFEPLLFDAIKETIQICKKYNVPLKSIDVSKFFYHFCLEKFCAAYQKCPSKFPKALVVYKISKNIPFSNKKLEKILRVLPIPWCTCSSFDSPDIELAVNNAITKSKSTSNKLNNFASKNQLYKFLKDFKKIKYFSSGSVDLSQSTE